MSKKLLSEAQVRRFQALATIKPINEMAYNEEEKVEETYNEELVNEEEEMEMADEAPEADEMDEADVELDEELVEKFIDAVSTIQSVADALGGEVDADMGGDDMDLDMDAGEEAPLELDAGDEDEGEEKDEEEEMLQEALSGINYIPSQKEIVKTVAQRVAKRLNEAKRAEARLNRALGKK